ncbi:MAG: hypothetical protein AAF696_30965, partial [Bacteroidota bacterium]
FGSRSCPLSWGSQEEHKREANRQRSRPVIYNLLFIKKEGTKFSPNEKGNLQKDSLKTDKKLLLLTMRNY